MVKFILFISGFIILMVGVVSSCIGYPNNPPTIWDGVLIGLGYGLGYLAGIVDKE